MIHVDNVTKKYTKDTETLKGVSFDVKPGEIYGLLGPNGAGKTTLMQIISTLLKPTTGEVTVCGLKADNEKNLLEIHRKLGFLTTEVKLDPMSTPDHLYDFFAELYDIPKDKALENKAESFAKFGIDSFRNKHIVDLSTGMKQKVSIAISLLHNPPVIVFDEPTNGLDIVTQKQVTDYLKSLKAEGRAVLLSTHIFSVAEALCDRIGVLIDGKIAAEGTVDELIAQTGTSSFEEAFFKLYVDNHRE